MDVRQVVTDRIIEMLAQGGNVFRERWTRAASRGMPRNGRTGAPYHGVNVLLLWEAAIAQSYASNVWLTYRQAEALGAQVRMGEKAVMCAYFERMQRRAADGAAGPDAPSEESSSFLLCRPFWVFNVAQIDGLPPAPASTAPRPEDTPDWAPVEAAMRLIDAHGAKVRHGFAQAAYAPDSDLILMPDVGRFTSPAAYCATAMHELVHWTGHPDRLARAFGARFGDAAYAFEELVAELGSAFLLGHLGLVDATIEGHAAYLDAWLQVLQRDRTAIFTAARLAGEAVEYLVGELAMEGT
ncbi:MAG: DUF1738 domain-containing protein [Comamonadaceae bacterium]|nr:MAG: DUF1738 domain-containing protein [Comamonadaceae bacterium]